MAKGVNDILNYYIQAADTKASIMIAGSVASATFLLNNFPDTLAARILYLAAATCLGLGLILASLVVLPRLPRMTGKGSVFWGDIAACENALAYRDRFTASAKADLLDEGYCALNYQTACILRRKILILRWSILTFLFGVIAALPHYLING